MDRLADAQATAQEQRHRQAELNGTINAVSRDATPSGGAEEDEDESGRRSQVPPGSRDRKSGTTKSGTTRKPQPLSKGRLPLVRTRWQRNQRDSSNAEWAVSHER